MLDEVETFPTQRGSVRYVSRDADGREYTTFREDIGERARELCGRRVRLEYHEERRGRYRNVYLDHIEPAEPEPGPASAGAAAGTGTAGTPPGAGTPGAGTAGAGMAGAGIAGAGTDPQEAAWRTAVEAAPWLVGQPERAVPPEQLYEQLKPFEEKVAADIEQHQSARDTADREPGDRGEA